MRVLILGTGTSTGVPAIGCKCPVCTSNNPKNKRLRPSVLVETKGASILIDTSPDLRQQALAYGITRIDAVLYTHAHADHVHGIDELRSFNFIQGAPIPVYGNRETMERVRLLFDYIFQGGPGEGGGKPMIDINVIDGPFEVAGAHVEPLEVFHGTMQILAYRIGNFAYLTDVSHIPEKAMERIKGLEVVVLDALRYKPHPTHMNIEQAIEAAREIGAGRTLFTHFSHAVDYGEAQKMLPPGMEPAYDGLEIQLEDE